MLYTLEVDSEPSQSWSLHRDHIHCHLQKAGTGAEGVHDHDVQPGASSGRS